LAVINATIDEELRNLFIDFAFTIEVTSLENPYDFLEENCNSIFDSDYIAYNLGNGPKCAIIKNTTTD
jgi:hypothetical protein